MNFFMFLTMIGGLALFLYGMHLMGEGLTKASGGRLESILQKLTSNPFMALLVGCGVTAVIQSSSATTVMVVGFVSSGIMKLEQAVNVIIGANIGTTVTAWLLSLTGIESSNFFVQLCKPSSFSPILALAGVILIMFSKRDRKRDAGMIMLGFAILMMGMDTMSGAIKPLAQVPEFTGILTMFSNPILGMLAGMILTAIIQSSSASVGILQALANTGAVSFGTAIPIIMGQNIGTCVTALISSVGSSKNAKRAALIHLYYNIIATVVFMTAFYGINSFVKFAFLEESISALSIAVVHSLFNVAGALLIMPFGKGLVKLVCLTVKDEPDMKELSPEEKELMTLDARFLDTPGLAIERSRRVAVAMARYAQKSINIALSLFDKYDAEQAALVEKMEQQVDRFEDELGTYLVKLSSRDLSEKESHTLSVLLHSIGDFERISDHALNIKQAADEMADKNMVFSDKATEELQIFSDAIKEILEIAISAFEKEDLERAELVEPLEEVVDQLNIEIKKRHIRRLRKGKCTIELGFVLSDITTNFERVADHCSNIAVCLLQVNEDNFDTHEYLDNLKEEDNLEFRGKVLAYREKYTLP
ncbi:MAG: Na/Pi cotransporter family protein [Lachnospiraceae bacterium]|nr:Na/Pi cotransporter family protein [Lachnospiraceae bacterium]